MPYFGSFLVPETRPEAPLAACTRLHRGQESEIGAKNGKDTSKTVLSTPYGVPVPYTRWGHHQSPPLDPSEVTQVPNWSKMGQNGPFQAILGPQTAKKQAILALFGVFLGCFGLKNGPKTAKNGSRMAQMGQILSYFKHFSKKNPEFFFLDFLDGFLTFSELLFVFFRSRARSGPDLPRRIVQSSEGSGPRGLKV